MADEHIALDGSLPLNTNGGMPSYANRGILRVTEAVQQLHGEAGAHQVSRREIALVHGKWRDSRKPLRPGLQKRAVDGRHDVHELRFHEPAKNERYGFLFAAARVDIKGAMGSPMKPLGIL